MISTLPDPALVARYDRPGPRYTSYPTVPAWRTPFGADDYIEALDAVGADPARPLALYVHLPFCAIRCHYCGCNAIGTSRRDVIDRYLDRVERELAMVVERLGSDRRVTQMHWGGGTPNLLDQRQTGRLVDALHRAFAFTPDAAWSIELDPRIVPPGQPASLRALGFSRVSLGVQDTDPLVQRAIGREQPFVQTRAVFESCREAGFNSINLDVVYGLPHQTQTRFERTLDLLGALEADRLAVFGYAHVPGMKANQKLIDPATLATGQERLQLFAMAVERFEDRGYQWIGFDHFARPDDELAVAAREARLHRNFMGYTVQATPDLLALGTSGIGDLAGRYAQADAKLAGYYRAIDAGRFPIVRGHRLDLDDRRRRELILHLMCNLELPADLPLEGGSTAAGCFPEAWARLAAFEADGLVEAAAGGWRVTRLGRFFLRNLGMEFDRYLASTTAGGSFSRTV